MKAYFLNLLRYNAWANRKIASFVIAAGEEAAGIEQQSSFSSIRSTMIHIWDAEYIWLKRVQGSVISEWPGKTFTGTTGDACVKMIIQSESWIDFLDAFAETGLEQPVSYKNIKGDTYSSTLVEIISHVVNHGTYHRGQIITMLRKAGFTEVGTTDLINFYRETGT